MRDFSLSLPMSLLRAREAVMALFRPPLRQHGLSEQQWRVLRALASVEAMETSELARVAFLLGPSLSRILTDLEARQLIERRVIVADRRRTGIAISRQGLALIEAIAPTSEHIYADIAGRFGVRKLARLHEMLGALERDLAEMPAARMPRKNQAE
jgi:homoprotocatechuate degradation regulator HpaR